MRKNDIRDILGFWYSKESFKSVYPEEEEIYSNESVKVLPWEDQDNSSSFLIFGGRIKLSSLDSILDPEAERFKTYNNEEEYSSVYFFTVDSNGNYKKGSFNISNCLYLFSKVWSQGNLNELEFEIASINDQLDSEISNANPKITKHLIENLNRSLGRLIFNEKIKELNTLDLNTFVLVEGEILARLKARTQKLKFLRKIADDVERSDAVYHFIADGFSGHPEIISIDESKYWNQNLNPGAYPKTAWPRKTLPNASQQWIINDLAKMDSKKIKSYNAPINSNRSLIIANLIAQSLETKADYLINLKKPADAFAMFRFTYPPQSNCANYYNPANNLIKGNLLLTAANKEILKTTIAEILDADALSIENSSIPYFDLQRNSEIYLSEVINKYNQKTGYVSKNSWGATAVYIETKADLELLIDLLLEYLEDKRFYFDKENRQFYLPEFKLAQEDYLNSARKAEEALETNNAVYQSAFNFNMKLTQADVLGEHINSLESKLIELETDEKELAKSLYLSEDKFLARENELNEIKRSINFWQKLLYKIFKIGGAGKELAEIEDNLEKNKEEIQNIKLDQENLAEHVKSLQEKIADLQNQLEKERNEIDNLRPQEEINKSNFGRNYIDRETYLNINSVKYHNSTPWEDEKSFKARSENFYYALNLLRTFILRSNELKQNLKRMKKILNEEFEAGDVRSSWQSLFSSLQLIIPLIAMPKSTIESLLEDAKISAIGTVVNLDPQTEDADELVSALYLADRAIFLGDFMQVRMKDTFNRSMQIALLDRFKVSEMALNYKHRSTEYLINCEENVLALGKELVPFSLRVQNKMVEPLFSLHNKICLDNLLLGKPRVLSPNLEKVFEQSSWLHLYTETVRGSLFSIQSADIAMVTICEYYDKHKILPDLGIVFFYNEVYQNWISFSLGYLEHKRSKYKGKVEEIYSWIISNSFLLLEWDGREFEEVIFIAGGSLDSDERIIEEFTSSVKPLNTLFNTVQRNLMILADPRVWANTETLAKVYSTLNEQDQNRSLKQKELTFVTFPFKANLLDDKSETTETYDKLKETIQNTGIKFNVDVYYSGDIYGISSLIEATYAEDAEKDVIITNKLEPEWIENNKNETNPRLVVLDILQEMDRLSQNKAVIIVDKEWLDKYLHLLNTGVNENKFVKVNEKDIKAVNTLLNMKFYKLENRWNLSNLSILKN